MCERDACARTQTYTDILTQRDACAHTQIYTDILTHIHLSGSGYVSADVADWISCGACAVLGLGQVKRRQVGGGFDPGTLVMLNIWDWDKLTG